MSNRVGDVVHLDAPSMDSKVHEFEMWLEPNDRISFDLASMENVQNYNRKGCVAEYEGPGIALDWVDVEGPIYDSWPPESHRRIFGNLPLTQIAQGCERASRRNAPARWNAADGTPPRFALSRGRRDHGKVDGIWTVQPEHPNEEAERLLRPLLTRLFRRPVSDAQLRVMMGW